jgi:hypothetical protein
MSNRVIFIDITRSFAIMLALIDHGMNDFDVWNHYSKTNYLLIKSITSTATPTFLIMFGIMLEIVYRKKLIKNNFQEMALGSLHRSLKCYIGGTLVSIAGVIGGVISLKRAFAASLFVTNNHFGGILFLYCLLILISIPLVVIRHYKGFKYILLINVVVWVLYYLLRMYEFSSPQLSYFTSLIFGVGGARGPSVLQSISFCSLGMILAQGLDTKKGFQFYRFTFISIIVVVVSIVAIVLIKSESNYIVNYITNVYRYENNPLYYLIGSLCAMMWLLLFSVLFPRQAVLGRYLGWFTVLSRRSLEAFTLGSILLNLFYFMLPTLGWDALGPVLFVILCLVLLLWYEHLITKKNPISYVRKFYYKVFYDNLLLKVSILFEKIYLKSVKGRKLHHLKWFAFLFVCG